MLVSSRINPKVGARRKLHEGFMLTAPRRRGTWTKDTLVVEQRVSYL
jgi:hypothetical protein